MIVGAGPAGLALALALAERGQPVTVVEAQPDSHRAFRGEALMPSGLAALEALGLGPIPAEVPQRRLRGWSFQVNGRELFHWDEPAAPRPGCTLIDQRRWLQALQQRARQLPTLTWHSGTAAVDLVEEAGWIAGVRLADGRQLPAGLVVACDGRSSLLRQRAGLTFPLRRERQEVLWFLVQEPSAAALADWLQGRFVTVLAGQLGYALFERAAGGVQVGMVCGSEEIQTLTQASNWRERWALAAPPDLADLWATIPEEAISGPQRLPVPVGCAERWHRRGVLLLGDAAHPMSPLRAQGLNMALRDAWLAAQWLLPQLRHPDPAGLETALQRIGVARQQEIRRLQALQQREARLGELLRHSTALRSLLAAQAGWIGPPLARRWAAAQQPLRQGVLPLTTAV